MLVIEDLTKLFDRDLDRLREEIAAFWQESNLWKTTGAISNSAGNLCLHLVGNLNTFIGKNIGNTGYVRDREAEFSLKDVPRQQLIAQVEGVKRVVKAALAQVDDQTIETLRLEHRLATEMSNTFLLMHLAAHLSYHLGQINYLRRALEA